MKRLASILTPLMTVGLVGCGTVTGPSPGSAQWTRSSAGLPGNGASYRCLTASGTTLLAGIDGFGVFRSTDGGVTWTAATTQPTSPTISSLTASGTTLLAGTDDGVFRSTDGGVTWARDTTQPADPTIYSLTTSGTTPLGGTASAGIWRYDL